MIQVRRYFLLATLITLFLAGCAAPRPTHEIIEDAEYLFASGQYIEAARQFNKLAADEPPTRATELQLRAAAALARADRIHGGRQILQTIYLDSQNPRHLFLLHLTEAHIALMERRANDVLRILAQPPGPGLDRPYLADYHDLRADAYTILGNRLETAAELVARERYLRHDSLIELNQRSIWEALSMLTERSLLQLRTAPPPDVLSGWMDLVRITKAHQLQPDMLKQMVAQWRQSYPNHPVQVKMLENLQSRSMEDLSIPRQIALVLPFESRFARAAEAVRDGFIAAYYSRRHDAGQVLRIYDAGPEPDAALEAYKRAISEGADFVVGPLSKEDIDRIADQGALPVPTLALNYSRESKIPRNLYQFGLSPEEEARQVAERTWLDGHINAAVLVPAGPWGDRVLENFQQRWEEIGGKVIEVQRYQAEDKDFSTPIRMLLNIDDSQRRHRAISLLINRSVEFQPSRRSDVDFIFLAAYPRQARQIRPQLRFFHAGDIPVYATSHVFTGDLNQERDRDMDDLMFGDMPWVLVGSSTHRGLRTSVEDYITRAGSNLQRLYALGIDAYNIIPALNPLRNYPYERYDGETGSLSLDPQLRVQRQLTWVRFRSGRPVALDDLLR